MTTSIVSCATAAVAMISLEIRILQEIESISSVGIAALLIVVVVAACLSRFILCKQAILLLLKRHPIVDDLITFACVIFRKSPSISSFTLPLVLHFLQL